MLGLTGRIWKDSYKNIIVIGGDSWSGVPTTYTKLTDGAGGVLPMSVSADGLMIPTGNKLVIGNSPGVRIENTITDQMHILATGKVNIVANKTVINGALSMVGAFSVSEIVGNTVTANSGTFTGTVEALAVQAGNINATGEIKASVIDATTIKGKIDFSEATSKEINMSGGVIVLGGGNKISNNANGQDFYVASNKVLMIAGDGFHPSTNEAADLGRSGRRWNNVHAASSIVKNLIVSNAQIKGGSVLVAQVDTTAINSPTINGIDFITDNEKSGKYYLNKDKTMHISKEGNNVQIKVVGGSLQITNKADLLPGSTNNGNIGHVNYRFNNAHIANIMVDTISSQGTIRHHGSAVIMPNLPVSSDGLTAGQVYRIGDVLKVYTGKGV